MASKPKSDRGPRLRTTASSQPTIRLLRSLEPTIPLEDAEQAELDRLIEVLRRGGVAERVDMAAVTKPAKLGVAIDRAFAATPFSPRSLCILVGHARGI